MGWEKIRYLTIFICFFLIISKITYFSPKMTEIGYFRKNKKKTNKNSQISYFFPTLFLVHRKVRCPPKVLPNPTSNHIYILHANCIVYNSNLTFIFPEKFTSVSFTSNKLLCR